jgi:Tol biopolymer transport system component
LLQKPSFLRSDVQNNRNEGPVSFSSNGRRVAFSRNKFISGTRQIAETGMNMSIYIADVEEGTWKNVKAFPFNGSNYATGFPCLSPDGNKLIFASTQPGGFGGWDIYVSNLTSNGWSEPRNLGTPLNTPGNEVTPFFDGEDLYFSSDWHKGFGGLDVFRASLGREEITEVFHMGPGVNSPRDDYGFIFNTDDNIGYLTSTRSGGRGNEDIWMLSKNGRTMILQTEPVQKVRFRAMTTNVLQNITPLATKLITTSHAALKRVVAGSIAGHRRTRLPTF